MPIALVIVGNEDDQTQEYEAPESPPNNKSIRKRPLNKGLMPNSLISEARIVIGVYTAISERNSKV